MQGSNRKAFATDGEEGRKHIHDANGDNTGVKINKIGDILVQELIGYRDVKITKPLIDMLAHIGKEDMAELAEALVSITSLKRKFTASEESVGGPVDVAVITKGDGFIWMKRKHYFDM